MNLSFPGVCFVLRRSNLTVSHVFLEKKTRTAVFFDMLPETKGQFECPEIDRSYVVRQNLATLVGGGFVCTGHALGSMGVTRDFFCSYKWSYGAPVNKYIYIHNTLVHIKITVWQHADMLGFVFFCVLGSQMGLDSFGVMSTIWCNLY